MIPKNVPICMSNITASTICKKPLPGLTTGRGVTTTLLEGDNAVRPLRILEAGGLEVSWDSCR